MRPVDIITATTCCTLLRLACLSVYMSVSIFQKIKLQTLAMNVSCGHKPDSADLWDVVLRYVLPVLLLLFVYYSREQHNTTSPLQRQ